VKATALAVRGRVIVLQERQRAYEQARDAYDAAPSEQTFRRLEAARRACLDTAARNVPVD
jgi:hypothetical protein